MSKILRDKISSGFLFIIVVLFLTIQAGLASSATIDVPGDFATIQEAIDASVDGDRIRIAAGTHTENGIVVDKGLTIFGAGIGTTVIDADNPVAIVFLIVADNVTIRDMTVQNSSQVVRFFLDGGIIDNTLLRRINFLNNASRGIELHNNTTVTNLVVDQCNFESTGIAFRISSSGHLDGAVFQTSTFTSNNMAIYVANDGATSTMNDVMIRGNTFTDHTQEHGLTGIAIYFEEGQNVTIRNNMFVDNRRDIQILKWYQAEIPVSNINIRENVMMGTTDAVFAIFNADNANSGQTRFENVRFVRNDAMTSDASAVFAGAHSSFQSADPSNGGIGWNTVIIRRNCFTGITTPERAVRYFIPAGILPAQALGGATLGVQRNWWGTPIQLSIELLMELPRITDYTPFQTTNICAATTRPGN